VRKRDPIVQRWLRTPVKVLLPKVEEWLMANYPTPFPVKVVVKKDVKFEGQWCYGVTNRRGRKLTISIREMRCRSCFWNTLIHEWAHAHTWGHDKLEFRRRSEGHDDVFILAAGKIERHLFIEGGQKEVLEWDREKTSKTS
jgi:hypothetical protein